MTYRHWGRGVKGQRGDQRKSTRGSGFSMQGGRGFSLGERGSIGWDFPGKVKVIAVTSSKTTSVIENC